MPDRHFFSGFLVAVIALLSAHHTAEAETFETKRCVNMGNALDAPEEGLWGHTIDTANFARIRAAGFDTVRLPVRWSAHLTKDGLIKSDFHERIDEVLNAALAADLNVVLNVHHYEAFIQRPELHYKTFLSIWEQLAYYYQDLPARVSFEVLNEPNGDLKGSFLRQAQAEAIAVIRRTNPTRTLILGGENWSGLDSLASNLKSEDKNIVYTFHYYDPFKFTHQNAPWTGADGPKGAKSWGSDADYDKVRRDMARAAQFVRQRGRPVFLGEFGAYEAAPENARRAYINAVSREAETAGIGWCVWNFTATFPLFDNRRKKWLPGQLEALGLTAP